jgi:hypothetical protein
LIAQICRKIPFVQTGAHRRLAGTAEEPFESLVGLLRKEGIRQHGLVEKSQGGGQ